MSVIEIIQQLEKSGKFWECVQAWYSGDPSNVYDVLMVVWDDDWDTIARYKLLINWFAMADQQMKMKLEV